MASPTQEKIIVDVERPKSSQSHNANDDDDDDEILTADFDNFQLNDRVFVNGINAAIIRFIGETKFAPGNWAGVELDQPIGKNNGSVGGVVYFKCESNFGLFLRPFRLTREPLPDQDLSSDGSTHSSVIENPAMATAIDKPTQAKPSMVKQTPQLKAGDRVLVQTNAGVKRGVLRFKGPTEFASGDWAGVELDEPCGKNDGIVAGKRYFGCEPNHGIFAPLNRISPDNQQVIKSMIPTLQVSSMLRKRSTSTSSLFSLRRKDQRSESHESLSSIASTQSYKIPRKKTPSTPISNKDNLNAYKSIVDLPTYLAQDRHKENDKDSKIAYLMRERDASKAQLNDLMLTLEKLTIEYQHAKRDRDNEITDRDERIRHLQSTIDDLRQRQERRPRSIPHEDDNEIELFQLQEELIKKDERLIQYESTLDNKKQEIQNLLKRIKELESKVNIFEQRQQRQLDTIDDLNLRLRKSLDECDQLREDVESRRAQIEQLKENSTKTIENGENKETIRMLQEEKEKWRLKCIEYEERVDGVDINRSEIDQQLIKLRKIIQEKEEREQLFDERETQLTDEIEKREKKLAKIEEQVRLLIEKTAADDEHLRQAHEQMRHKERDLMRLNETLHTMQERLNKAEVDLRLVTVESSEMKNTLDSREEEIETMRNGELTLTTRIQRLLDENVKLRQQINDLSTDTGNDRLIELNENLIRKQSELTESEVKIGQLEKTLADYECEKRCLLDQIGEFESRNQILFGKCDELEKKLMSLSVERDRLADENRGQNERLRDEERRQRLRENELKRERKDLETKLAEKESAINDMMMKIERLSSVDEWKKNSFDFVNKSVISEKLLSHSSLNTIRTLTNISSNDDSHLTVNNSINQITLDEREQLESQINFLNSVIVDMQRKNDEISARIQIFEEIGLNDFGESRSRPVSIFNGLTNRQQSNENRRSLCANCSLFDLHESHQCPRRHIGRTNGHNGSANYVNNHNGNGNYHHFDETAFCGNCTIFGHMTRNCPLAQHL